MDGGARERGDAHEECVRAPQNFREIQGGRGGVRVPSIGVPVSKIIKIKIIMIKSQEQQFIPCKFINVQSSGNAIILPILKF
jgi:hypothetical protein